MDNLVFDVTLILQSKNGGRVVDTFQVDDFVNIPVAVERHTEAANTLGFDVTMVTVTSRKEN